MSTIAGVRISRHVRLTPVRIVLFTGAIVISPTPTVAAQDEPHIAVSANLLYARSSEFETTSVGIGGLVAWRPVPVLGIEAALGAYPADFPGEGPFSSGQVEGLFGVTARLSFERVRPFAKARAGFLAFRESSRPIACIAIFPPPLSCTLAAGRTLPVLEIGGGTEIELTRRTFVRIDAADRILKYPGPVFSRGRSFSDGFRRHDFSVTVGAGLRF